jgi:anti-sigma regulatory factor (Ser/Thr protein kinase)
MAIGHAVGSLNESLPAVPASIARARSSVGGFAARAGASCEQLDEVRLLVSEAVTNVVQHAYEDTPGDVRVSASACEGELWVLVADDGCGLQVRRDSPGLGLGLEWMASFSDELTLLERACGGLEVRMRFALDAGYAERALEGPGGPARLSSADR